MVGERSRTTELFKVIFSLYKSIPCFSLKNVMQEKVPKYINPYKGANGEDFIVEMQKGKMVLFLEKPRIF